MRNFHSDVGKRREYSHLSEFPSAWYFRKRLHGNSRWILTEGNDRVVIGMCWVLTSVERTILKIAFCSGQFLVRENIPVRSYFSIHPELYFFISIQVNTYKKMLGHGFHRFNKWYPMWKTRNNKLKVESGILWIQTGSFSGTAVSISKVVTSLYHRKVERKCKCHSERVNLFLLLVFRSRRQE